jgi:hypothetical protein
MGEKADEHTIDADARAYGYAAGDGNVECLLWIFYTPSLFHKEKTKVRLATSSLHCTYLEISSVLYQTSSWLSSVAPR